MHKTIKKVTQDLEQLRYNTAISAMMEWYNYLSKIKNQISKIEIETYLKLLAPFAPHMAEELWQQLKVPKEGKVSEVSKGEIKSFDTFDTSRPFDNFSSIHLQTWPTYNPKFLEEKDVTIVVQVNGKLRDTIKYQKLNIKNQVEIEDKAKKSARVMKYLNDKTVVKIVYVEGKVINFVTE